MKSLFIFTVFVRMHGDAGENAVALKIIVD